MEELLVIIIQFFIEVIVQVIFELPFDLFKSKTSEKTEKNFIIAILYVFAGVVVGCISLWVFPNSLIQNSWLRCVNLIVAPLISYSLSKRLSKNKENVNPIIQARFAFLFTFSLVAVRLVYSHH
jgi:hypothetical protein